MKADPAYQALCNVERSRDLARAEAEWRREAMSAAKDALACGDNEGAWEALTRHERERYPWAPGEPGNQGPTAMLNLGGRSVEVVVRDGVLVPTDATEETAPVVVLCEVLPGIWRETLTNETWPG